MAQTFDQAITTIEKLIDHDIEAINHINGRIADASAALAREQSLRDAAEARIANNQAAVRLLKGSFDAADEDRR